MAVPVVDSIGRLVGRITVDDVMDEVREQAERDYQLASGLSQDVETDDNVFRQTTARLPWLLIGMLGGIGNSMILGNFDTTFAAHPEMALYIPLIGGTGGNVGTPVVSIGCTRSCQQFVECRKHIQADTERIGGCTDQCHHHIDACLHLQFCPFWRKRNSQLFCINQSVCCRDVCVYIRDTGSMTLEKLKIDPAIATGPFISITNDIIGMLMYMGITVLLS